jgi:hypothetical protein
MRRAAVIGRPCGVKMGNVMADDWKRRLEAAIKDSGKSLREISLVAGNGPGYLHSVFMEGKEPTVANLLKICRAANVSIYRVLVGFEMTPANEELLKLLTLADDDLRRSLFLLLQRGVRTTN